MAVANPSPDKLLGVRDGFRRYFREGLAQTTAVVVVPQPREAGPRQGLAVSDEETLGLARTRAMRLQEELGDAYHFYVGSEGGLHSLEIDGRVHYFVRNWTVILAAIGEAWGASGSVELPERLVAGLRNEQILFAVPGTRRRGGMISSITGGLESRRTAVALSTLHALSSLFYGLLEARGSGRR